jgi:hypothetical protein
MKRDSCTCACAHTSSVECRCDSPSGCSGGYIINAAPCTSAVARGPSASAHSVAMPLWIGGQQHMHSAAAALPLPPPPPPHAAAAASAPPPPPPPPSAVTAAGNARRRQKMPADCKRHPYADTYILRCSATALRVGSHIHRFGQQRRHLSAATMADHCPKLRVHRALQRHNRRRLA